jgi:hypothetical protein
VGHHLVKAPPDHVKLLGHPPVGLEVQLETGELCLVSVCDSNAGPTRHQFNLPALIVHCDRKVKFEGLSQLVDGVVQNVLQTARHVHVDLLELPRLP